MTRRALGLFGIALATPGLPGTAGCLEGGPSEAAVRVYAASSLTEAFRDLESAFEARHPGIDVRPTFAGSQVLRLQIEQGAPADVFASANPLHLRALVEANRVESSRVFARSSLALIVPVDNPAGINAFADLPKARRLVLGTEDVPIGRYARTLLRRASRRLGASFSALVLDGLASEELNVRQIRAKVELGEADAAFVYRTDLRSARNVRSVPIPDDLAVHAAYTVGRLVDAPNPEAASAWVGFLASDVGRSVLEEHGFSLERL